MCSMENSRLPQSARAKSSALPSSFLLRLPRLTPFPCGAQATPVQPPSGRAVPKTTNSDTFPRDCMHSVRPRPSSLPRSSGIVRAALADCTTPWLPPGIFDRIFNPSPTRSPCHSLANPSILPPPPAPCAPVKHWNTGRKPVSRCFKRCTHPPKRRSSHPVKH
jgi:hypothetical protein